MGVFIRPHIAISRTPLIQITEGDAAFELYVLTA
jgi:hypothetical protein